jgi:tripartite ATP-independent transporter DctP family solute receptor
MNARFAQTAGPNENFHLHYGALRFKEHVERLTDGNLTIEIIAGGQLGGWNEAAQQTINGTVEITFNTAGHMGPFNSNVNCWTVPYIFRNIEVPFHVMDMTEWGQQFRQNYTEQTGLRMVGWWDNGGFRHFSANTSLESIEDFQGLDIRVQPSETYQELVRQLGANPQVLDAVSLYEGLDQGVVDGQENALPNFLIIDTQEVQSHIIMDGHTLSPLFLHVNDEWYQNLPASYQNAVDRAGLLASVDARRFNRIDRVRSRRIVEEAGVTVYDPSLDEKQAFREQTQEPVEEVARDVMEDPDLLDGLYEAIQTAEDRLGYEEQYFEG